MNLASRGFLLLAGATLLARVAAGQSRGPSNRAELEAFVDGVMASALDANHVAGATVSVVKDGEVFLAKGYGYADVEGKKKVDAEGTLFRVGSVSKLFVWTAAMQLAGEGRIDLDADINTYLKDMKIPETFPKPITMASLMTHTPGFEDRVVGLFSRDETNLEPLGRLLARQLPARVRPPGEIASYSNHGAALAAYVVELVSGTPWETYIERNVLDPLDMRHAKFAQPLPESLRDAMSKGYRYRGGRFEEQTFEYIPLAPAGALSATATDMARFMIAHLQDGRLGTTRILEEATARTMKQELFRHTPNVNPMSHGFIDLSQNDQWIVGHGGDTIWFHTMLALLPDHGVGLFVSTNTEGGARAVQELVEAFMNRYYPVADPPPLQAPSDFASRAERFAGTYRAARYSHTTFAKLAAALGGITVTSTKEGLRTTGATPRQWVEVGPLAFREKDGHRTLTFRADGGGRITHLFVDRLPIIAFERNGLVESPRFHLALAALNGLLFLWAILIWPASALVRRRLGVRRAPGTNLPRPARVLAFSAALLFVAFAVVLAGVLSNPMEIAFGVPTLLRFGLILPLAGAVLALAAGAANIPIWRNRRGRLAGRLYYAVLTFGFLVFLWQLHYWNLLGFRY